MSRGEESNIKVVRHNRSLALRGQINHLNICNFDSNAELLVQIPSLWLGWEKITHHTDTRNSLFLRHHLLLLHHQQHRGKKFECSNSTSASPLNNSRTGQKKKKVFGDRNSWQNFLLKVSCRELFYRPRYDSLERVELWRRHGREGGITPANKQALAAVRSVQRIPSSENFKLKLISIQFSLFGSTRLAAFLATHIFFVCLVSISPDVFIVI